MPVAVKEGGGGEGLGFYEKIPVLLEVLTLHVRLIYLVSFIYQLK